MARRSLTIEEVLSLLRETPQRIAALTDGLVPAQLHTAYPELEFQPSFRSFLSQRAELLAALEPLPRESWSRAATVTGAGRPLERIVHFYVQWLACNERSHVKQIERIVTAVHT